METEKRKKTLEWTEEMDNNFWTLKESFGRQPIWAYPQFNEKPPSSKYGWTSPARTWVQYWNRYRMDKKDL